MDSLQVENSLPVSVLPSAIEKTPSEPRQPKVDEIQRVTASQYNISGTDIRSEKRTANIVTPRQLAMYIAKTMTRRSLPDIGRRFGGRDHTTVLHAVRKMEALLDESEQLRKETGITSDLLANYEAIKKTLQGDTAATIDVESPQQPVMEDAVPPAQGTTEDGLPCERVAAISGTAGNVEASGVLEGKQPCDKAGKAAGVNGKNHTSGDVPSGSGAWVSHCVVKAEIFINENTPLVDCSFIRGNPVLAAAASQKTSWSATGKGWTVGEFLKVMKDHPYVKDGQFVIADRLYFSILECGVTRPWNLAGQGYLMGPARAITAALGVDFSAAFPRLAPMASVVRPAGVAHM